MTCSHLSKKRWVVTSALIVAVRRWIWIWQSKQAYLSAFRATRAVSCRSGEGGGASALCISSATRWEASVLTGHIQRLNGKRSRPTDDSLQSANNTLQRSRYFLTISFVCILSVQTAARIVLSSMSVNTELVPLRTEPVSEPQYRPRQDGARALREQVKCVFPGPSAAAPRGRA